MVLIGAKEPGDRGYETEWLATDEVPDEFATPRTIGKDKIVFKQKLIFDQLGVADVALQEPGNDEEYIPAGEQYYKALTAPEHELWCTANMKMPESEFQRVVIGRVYSQYCIYDNDKDGVFDAFFKRARTIPIMPTVRGKIRSYESMQPIRPLKLNKVDPSSLRTNYYWGVVYLKNTGKAGSAKPLFTRFAGSDYGMFPLEERFSGQPGENETVGGDDFNISYSVLDGQIEVHSFNILPSESLRIHGTNCGMINGC
jgi:hypothetical protein